MDCTTNPMHGGQHSNAPCCVTIDDSRPATTRLRVLLVEDNLADVEMVLAILRKEAFDVSSEVVQTAEKFTLCIQTITFEVILADYNLPQWRGIEALEILHRESLDVPLIVVTGYLGEGKAVECVKQGATHCVLNDHLTRLPVSIRRALEERQLRELRRLSEKDLVYKATELVRSNAELEQFAYVASHDLQEPLRMIANYTQLLAKQYLGQLDKQADQYLRYSVDGAVRMQALIQDLLMFSRVGKAEIEPRTTECRLLVEQGMKNLQAAIEESGAAVNCNSLPVVVADPSQLTQVFQNLIANAIKFRGTETPVIKIDSETNYHGWELTVSDNGIGIPAENWQDIFVIFRRLHTRSEYAGSGIGLSICKKIIERHGGEIWIKAQSMPGCCFKFTLPTEPSQAAAQEAEA